MSSNSVPSGGTPAHLALLREVSIFRGLPDRELRAVAELEHEREYAKNALIFYEGQPGQTFYYVKSGLVKIYKLTPDGKEQILAVWGRGELFGAVLLLDEGTYPANAEALSELHVGTFYASEFRQLMAKKPSLGGQVLQEVACRLRTAYNRIRDLALRDVKSRLAGALLTLADREKSDNRDCPEPKLQLDLTHQQLASLVGASRETVTRALNEFRSSGAMEPMEDNRYRLNREVLESYL